MMFNQHKITNLIFFQKNSANSDRYRSQTLRGLTLFEALLALSIGAAIISGGIYTMNRYNDNLIINNAAGTLTRLSLAANQYADDNYEQLASSAPQRLDIEVLSPYLGKHIDRDALKTSYHLSTRSYTYPVPDPVSGTTTDKTALQILVVAESPHASKLANHATLRADVANRAGTGSGFISTDQITCTNAGGTGKRSAGNICGSYGAYSFDASAFPASNLSNAAYVSLITKAEKTPLAHMLYRYDFNDEELNTMNTTLDMANNDITNVAEITSVDTITMDPPTGTDAHITTNQGSLKIASASGSPLSLNPGNGEVIIGNDSSQISVIAPTGNRLQLGQSNDTLSIGPLVDDTINLNGIDDTKQIGSGDLFVQDSSGKTLSAHSVNSLHAHTEDPLRLQNINNGEVVIGRRVAYTPDGSTRYDISDGNLVAQTLSLQDIDCADCGGSLSNILPKWRHMGTYFIKDLPTHTTTGTYVPKPNCGSRRKLTTRTSNGEDPAYNEQNYDTRYEPKILIIPKKFGVIEYDNSAPGNGRNPSKIWLTEMYHFKAEHADATRWVVTPEAKSKMLVPYGSSQFNKDRQADPHFGSDSIKTASSLQSIYQKITPQTVMSEQETIKFINKLKPSWSAGGGGGSTTNGIWTARREWYPDHIESVTVATALAKTFCHFTGGADADPIGIHNGPYPTNTDITLGFERVE